MDAKKTEYISNFEFVGTIDNAPYLCVPTALQWRETIGGEEAIRKYCWTLAKQGGELVAERLGTEIMDNKTATLTKCCMVNVKLPISLSKVKDLAKKAGIEESELGILVRDWMSKTVIQDYNTFVQSLFYAGSWWVRLSAQVYLDMEDFEWAATTLAEVCERVNKGEWVPSAGPESKL